MRPRPARGALVIAGGGTLPGTGFLETLVERAGGPTKRFLIVRTAGGNRRPDGTVVRYDEAAVIAPFRAIGLRNVRILHRRTAINQHIDARNRWEDLIPVIRRFPDLLGIGLS